MMPSTTDSTGTAQTVITDSSGEYTAVVPAGPAEIDVDENTLPPGSKQTGGVDPSTVDVPAGGTATDKDGLQYPTGSPTGSPTKAPEAAAETGSPSGAPSNSPSESPSRSPAPSEGGSGKLVGLVFEDTNGNGAQDEGEPGIEGVNVVITTSKGNMQTVGTNSNGEYMVVVPAGLFVSGIDENTLPAGTKQNAGMDHSTVDV
jgi:hypothetical protein